MHKRTIQKCKLYDCPNVLKPGQTKWCSETCKKRATMAARSNHGGFEAKSNRPSRADIERANRRDEDRFIIGSPFRTKKYRATHGL